MVGGGMHGGGMHGRGCVWQGACVAGGACMASGMALVCMAGDVRGRRNSHCSGWYTSYWNAFLLFKDFFFQLD